MNHIDTPAKVTGFLPAEDGLKKALTGADLVVIPAGIARKPGMTRDGMVSPKLSLFNKLTENLRSLQD